MVADDFQTCKPAKMTGQHKSPPSASPQKCPPEVRRGFRAVWQRGAEHLKRDRQGAIISTRAPAPRFKVVDQASGQANIPNRAAKAAHELPFSEKLSKRIA